jgi:hypothetical protein
VKDVPARKKKRDVVVKRQQHNEVLVDAQVNVIREEMQEQPLNRRGHVHVVRTVDVPVAAYVDPVVLVPVTMSKFSFSSSF